MGWRPMACKIFSECVVKCVVVVAFALGWNRFMNSNHLFSLLEHTLFTAGVIFLAAAWFCYLKLDQVCIHHLLEKTRKTCQKQGADIADYIETEPDSSDTLSKKQKTVCHLISNAFTGAGFVFISIVVSF